MKHLLRLLLLLSTLSTARATIVANAITTNGPAAMTNVVTSIVGASGLVANPFDTNTPSATTNIVQTLIGASTNSGFNQQWATNEWPQEGAAWNWAAEPVPQLAWTTFFEQGLVPTENAVTNAIQVYKTNNLIAAGYSWFDLDEGWAYTNRDANGNITWNSNNFSEGMPFICNYAHTNGAKIFVWLTSGSTAGGGAGAGYASGLTNIIRDIQTVAAWGVDGVFLDEIGYTGGADNNSYFAFQANKLRNFFFGINSLRYNLTNAAYNAINWQTGYVGMVERVPPFRAMSDAVMGWNFEYLLNDFFVPNYGSTALIGGLYDTIPHSRSAQTNLASIVDTCSNMVMHISPGHFPIVGSFAQGGGSDLQFNTNFLTAAAMQCFSYFMDKRDVASLRLTQLTNASVRAIAKDPLCKAATLVSNATSGEAVLNAWVRPLTNGWAIWFWNRSTNTSTTITMPIVTAFGQYGEATFVDAWSGIPYYSTNGLFTVTLAAFEMRLFTVSQVTPNPNFAVVSGVKSFPSDMTNGLVLRWNFDDGAGTSATDTSGNSLTGTLSTSSLWSGAGKTLNGLYINANNGYVSRANSAQFDTFSAFSQSIWFKVTNAPSNGFLFSKDDGSGHSGGWAVYLGDATHIQAYGSSGNFITGGSGFVIPAVNDGIWHQVIYVWDGAVQSLYLDTLLLGSKLMSGQFPSFDQAINVGGRGNGSGFDGQLDNFRVYNVALRADQVKQLYNLEYGRVSYTQFGYGVIENIDSNGNATPALQTTNLFSIIQTNFISGVIYSNFYGAPVQVSTTAILTLAGVAGDATLEARAISYATNRVTAQSLITSLATTNGGPLFVNVPINGTYTFTNASAGSGDSATCLGGQILVY